MHIGGTQADICSNWTPLGMTLLSEKLGQAGYTSHFVGKTNIGFQTIDHMPINRGFASHVGYLYGAESYSYGKSPLLTHGTEGIATDSAAWDAVLVGSAEINASSSDPSADGPLSRLIGHQRARGGEPRIPGGSPLQAHSRQRRAGCTPYTPECIPEADLEAHTSASWFTMDFWEVRKALPLQRALTA